MNGPRITLRRGKTYLVIDGEEIPLTQRQLSQLNQSMAETIEAMFMALYPAR